MLEANNREHRFSAIDRTAFSNVRPMFLVTRVSKSATPVKQENRDSQMERIDTPGLESREIREEIYNSFGIVASQENRARQCLFERSPSGLRRRQSFIDANWWSATIDRSFLIC